jgi:hypothetical protein
MEPEAVLSARGLTKIYRMGEIDVVALAGVEVLQLRHRMSELFLAASIARADRRFGGETGRRRRADAGGSRLAPRVEAKLQAILAASFDRPRIGEVHAELSEWCRKAGLASPSRATVYNALDRAIPPAYDMADLPPAVRLCLHNVARGRVPGDQIVFAAFNYGDTRALSFAAAMPWSCLTRAARIPGFRPKSRALLRAVMSHRGL